MKIKSNIAVSDNGFVFNPASGESFMVNPVGLGMLNMMRKGQSQEQIVAAIQEDYRAEAMTIERDLLDFVEMMRQYRLLQYDDE
ncbi:MAG: PqqD family protein [Bacteroidales bacterium]|nr:PqqD family protein [Bacteroidales bacterium]